MDLKKGQMELSFGMIFSIILIIVFLGFAFFAIQKFLGLKDSVQVGQFLEEFENDIDKAWRGLEASQEEEYLLPKKVEYVCFVDFTIKEKGEFSDIYRELETAYFGSENLIFYPVGSGDGLDSKEIKHIDLEKITLNENPNCIKNEGGKIKIIIQKEYGEPLVSLR